MTDDVPVTDVFADVKADPDAVIDAYGAESIDDLVDGPGEHDPEPDERIDGDVELATERLCELADVHLDAADGSADESSGDPPESVVSEPAVEVLPGDGQTIEEFLGLEPTEPPETRTRDGHVLVGPDPSATRVSNETFGGPDADPAAEAELASTVFEWAS